MSLMALGNALSGLRAAQQQIDVLSNNISNAGTAGYTRKTLPQMVQVVDTTGQINGVKTALVIRNVDINLEKDLWTQVSAVSVSSVKATYLSRIEAFHGSTYDENSIAAEIADLKDAFAALSDTPSDGALLQATYDQAERVADRFNDFGDMVTQIRRDAQDEIVTTVDKINSLLTKIGTLNTQIKGSEALNRSSAGLEDQRDLALKELSENIAISSFMRGDGVLVIQTKNGVQLVDDAVTPLSFTPAELGPTTTYPGGAAAVYVGENPLLNVSAVDITGSDIGGKLGGLVDIRDKELIRYQAQMDELAQKLALRFERQGLRLFTDPIGRVPSDDPPDISVDPPTPVSYVGFASTIQINKAIRDDITLIQQGTYDEDKSIPAASGEVIRRVLEFAFGQVDYQEADGTIDLRVALPATDLQGWLGLSSENRVTSGLDLSSFNQISDGVSGTSDLMEDLSDFFLSYPNNDRFRITFGDSRVALGPTQITIDLSDASTNFPIGVGGVENALDQIIAEINAQITAAAVPAGLNASASKNSYGQLVLSSTGNITLSATGFANAMGTDSFTALGFTEGTFETQDPYLDIQVGNDTPVRITIEPGDDQTDLINKLTYNASTGEGVPGLHVNLDASGHLTLRPGGDGGPDFGGDLRIISGGQQMRTAVNPVLATLPDEVSVAGALFGSYSVSGTTVSEVSPVVDVGYESETYAGSGVYVSYRQNYLGQGGDTSTYILTGGTLVDFAQKIVTSQSQEIALNETRIGENEALRDLLEEKLLNQSGVNLDEEMANLIFIQTCYSASARAVNAVSDMFDELISMLRR